ncbi:Aste57867_22745 [Aphanomyces stellatus]|uniref:Aste57867_22745 protein n=1 Tax=Aphanomyces stellatus TaxID=120398 RepID=A0A485LKT4_9STRA|nr:hypothetical protein As57867_022675 [Aphanomyces stellatus]VFT99398.1 Aste57867_22745 [Aphanomyces stellatus]
MASPRAVLVTSELLSLIALYQHGIYEDMAPFQLIQPFYSSWYSCHVVESLRKARVLLHPWLASFGTTRLSLLFDWLPHMKTTLAYYSVYDHISFVWEFIVHECNPDDDFNLDVACLAARWGSLKTFQVLADHGMLQNARDNAWLMGLAVKSGHVDIVQYCGDTLLANAPVEVVLSAWRSSLDAAATKGHVDVLRVILPHVEPTSAVCALQLTCLNGCADAVTLLVEHSVIPDDKLQGFVSAAFKMDHVPLIRGLIWNQDGHLRSIALIQGWLQRSVKLGSVNVAKVLAGAIANHQDIVEIDARSVYIAAEEGHVVMLELLRRLKPVVQQEPVPSIMKNMPWYHTPTLIRVAGCVPINTLQLVLEITNPARWNIEAAISGNQNSPDIVRVLETYESSLNDNASYIA